MYRAPDSSDTPIINLENCLSQLYTEDPDNSPCILIGGDFNFPDIIRQDGNAQINTSPTHGIGFNKSFVDVINDHGLEQFVNAPTRGSNVSDLLFCSHPNFISSTEIIPGISDHEAILIALIKQTNHFLIN